jgi:hypothetical protein
MFEDSVKKAEAEARAEVFRGQPSEERSQTLGSGLTA